MQFNAMEANPPPDHHMQHQQTQTPPLPPPSTQIVAAVADVPLSWQDVGVLEKRVVSHLKQLRFESSLFFRLMRKNKNQHRHCLYFRALTKVKRDLNLLEIIDLPSLLRKHFDVIRGHGNDTAGKLLERFRKLKKKLTERYDPYERLLGACHLLAQMVEPIIEAGLKISSLLGQSFFITFSMTVLALLARIRVLIQQILLDTVHVFNQSSEIFLETESLKLCNSGLPVSPDYCRRQKQKLILKCVWNDQKFCLSEKFERRNENKKQEDQSLLPSKSIKVVHKVSAGASSMNYEASPLLDEDLSKIQELSMDVSQCLSATPPIADGSRKPEDGYSRYVDTSEEHPVKHSNGTDIFHQHDCQIPANEDSHLKKLNSKSKKRAAAIVESSEPRKGSKKKRKKGDSKSCKKGSPIVKGDSEH